MRNLFVRVRDWLKPPPRKKTAADYEYEAKVARAEAAIERSDKEHGKHVYVERECGKLHPSPSGKWEYSKALDLTYQECPSCGMITGVMVA